MTGIIFTNGNVIVCHTPGTKELIKTIKMIEGEMQRIDKSEKK
jgi:hypothetical protein